MDEVSKDTQSGCERCGRCCFYTIYKNNKPILKKCKHMRTFQSGRTVCRVYKHAINERTKHGHRIDTYLMGEEKHHIFCTWRKDGQWNYDGCPFNTKKTPQFEDYIENIGLKVPWRK